MCGCQQLLTLFAIGDPCSNLHLARVGACWPQASPSLYHIPHWVKLPTLETSAKVNLFIPLSLHLSPLSAAYYRERERCGSEGENTHRDCAPDCYEGETRVS
jgi:hypothetical protein